MNPLPTLKYAHTLNTTMSSFAGNRISCKNVVELVHACTYVEHPKTGDIAATVKSVENNRLITTEDGFKDVRVLKLSKGMFDGQVVNLVYVKDVNSTVANDAADHADGGFIVLPEKPTDKACICFNQVGDACTLVYFKETGWFYLSGHGYNGE